MIKIIFIHFVLIVTYCETAKYKWPKEGDCIYLADKWLHTLFSGLCSTDGKTYRDEYLFKCVQGTEYGKRVNLKLSHNGACFQWRLLYGIHSFHFSL